MHELASDRVNRRLWVTFERIDHGSSRQTQHCYMRTTLALLLKTFVPMSARRRTETDACHHEHPWMSRHSSKRPRGCMDDESSEKDNQALALECLCKMIELLDGDFAQQVVGAGGLQPRLMGSM